MRKKLFAFIIFIILSAGSAFSQTLALDNALKSATVYLTEKLPQGTLVVVLNFSSKFEPLSNYVIEELTANIVNSGRLTAVERQNLDVIQNEMKFQMSGEVSDESAQAIGKKLGAQTIISGSIDSLGNIFRMRVRAIEVQTAAILGMQTFNVAVDEVLSALTGGAVPAVAAAPSASAGQKTPARATQEPSGKPVKKTPAKPRNFEIIQGSSVRTPIDMKKFEKAAEDALYELEFKIVQKLPGVILFRPAQQSMFGNWWVQIRLCYWNDEYWYEYVNSYNFDANPGRNVIDDRYHDLIKDTEKELKKAYY
jgi:TolB-like protein